MLENIRWELGTLRKDDLWHIHNYILYVVLAWWWWSKTLVKDSRNNRLVCLNITEAMQSTPTDLPLLHRVIKSRTLSGSYRLKINSAEGKTLRGHAAIFKELDKCPKLSIMPDKVILAKEVWEQGQSLVKLNALVFYTYGSEASQKTRAGIYGIGRPGRRILSVSVYADVASPSNNTV